MANDKKLTPKEKAFNANTYLQLGKSFNILQKRIIHFVIKQLQEELFALNDQKYKGKAIERTLFGDAYFHIPCKTIDPLNQDTAIRSALKGLQIPINDKNFIGNFILSAKREDNNWRLLFPEKTVHFLTEVSAGVTPLQTIVYLTSKSLYTIRMYELLMRFRDTGKWYVAPADLCDLLGLTVTYRKNSALVDAKVLEVAQKELRGLYDKKQSEICFTYEKKHGGRGNKVLEYIFTIFWLEKNNKAVDQNAKDMEFVVFHLRRVMLGDDIGEKYKKANQVFVDKSLSQLISREQLGKFANRLERFIEKNGDIPTEQQGRLIRYILEEDFGIIT